MDEVGAKVQVDVAFPKDIEDLRNKLANLKLEKVEVVKSQKYEKAAELRDEERNVVDLLETKKLEWEIEMEESRIDITEDDIYEVVSQITKIPITKLDSNETKNLLNLENSLKKLVIGQDEAIQKISKAIRRNRVANRS